jgi:chaperone LolA
MPRFPLLFSLALSLFIAAPVATAEEAAAPGLLRAFLSEVATLEAAFSQTLVEPGTGREQVSEGRLYLKRPKQFRWDYREPVPQLVVADGTDLWLYDPDLEQATVRSLDDGLSSTPAMLLSGEGRLEDTFEVGAAYAEAGIDWVELKPLDPESDFDAVRVGFEAGELAAMDITDTLGQTTRIRFSGVRRNIPLDPGLFVFEPPPGADVLRDSDF